MRCPNCGMDIVIATHLCPHCGYAHDFHGRIEPRRDLPDPCQITPQRASERPENRQRAAFTAGCPVLDESLITSAYKQ